MNVLGSSSRIVARVVTGSSSLHVQGRRCFSRVGFIGLGNMGAHMAKNLLKKGHKLIVYDINETALSNLVEAGADRASRPADVAKHVDAVVSMLRTHEHVLDVYNKDGLLSSAKKNTLFIDSSTIGPLMAQTVHKDAEMSGVRFIDAPVSGGVIGARDGTLTFMVGGSKENVQLAEPLLNCMGSRVVHCGDVGMGQAAKLCNNMILAISMIGVAEAFNLGRRLGLDPKLFADIVNTSSGRCWSSELYNPVPGVMESVPSSKDYEGGFGVNLIAKDLGLAQSVATTVEAPVPLGSMAHQIYRTLISHGLGEKDIGVIYQFLKGRE